MTIAEVMKMIEAMGNDAGYEITVIDDCDTIIEVQIHDFEGFDDDYSEVMREYDNPEAVEAFEEMLDEQYDCALEDYGTPYFGDYAVRFDGFNVEVHYDSEDI